MSKHTSIPSLEPKDLQFAMVIVAIHIERELKNARGSLLESAYKTLVYTCEKTYDLDWMTIKSTAIQTVIDSVEQGENKG